MMKFLKQWWLYALIFSLPFERIPSLDIELSSQVITLRLSFLIALSGWLLFRSKYLKKEFLSPANPIFWLGAYIAVCLLSILVSINTTRSLMVTIVSIFTIGTGILTALVLKHYSLRKAQTVLFLSAAIVSVFGVYQFIGDSIGLSNAWTGLREIYQKQVFGFPRIQSTALEPLFFGNYLALPLLLTFALIAAGIKARYTGLLLYLFSFVMALTLSRGAIAASIIGSLVLIALLQKTVTARGLLKGGALIAAGALSAISMIFVIGSIVDEGKSQDVNNYVKQSSQLQSTSVTADSDRVVNKKLALEAFKERPLLGYGIGSFGTYAKREMPDLYPPTSNNSTVNNEYYEIVAETGALGLLSLVGFVVTMVIAIINKLKTKLDSYTKIWVSALTAMSAGYLVQYYSFSTLYILHIWVFIGILMGLVLINNDETKKI